MSTISEQMERLRQEIRDRVDRLTWLKRNQSKLVDLPPVSTSCPTGIVDFDNLEHKDVVKVIRAFGGKWKKTPASDNTINYEGEFAGVKIRCYAGQPPPSCKIIEVEEHVPEQIIPASVRKVRKMVCLPEVGAVIALAAQKGENEQVV